MSERDTPRMGVIAQPVRTNDTQLPQCRCVLLNSDGTKGDRCAGHIPDPDSPLCDGCERSHRHLIEEGIAFAMVDLNIR